MSMFNEYQRDRMRELNTMTPEERCYCGWARLGECYNTGKTIVCQVGKTCADKLRERELRKADRELR